MEGNGGLHGKAACTIEELDKMGLRAKYLKVGLLACFYLMGLPSYHEKYVIPQRNALFPLRFVSFNSAFRYHNFFLTPCL